MSATRLIAHRGHAAVRPENTLAAVESALRAGARAIEIDVQLAADGAPFLMHDRTLERMCGVWGALADLNSDAVRSLRAAERERFGETFADEPVASLADFVARMRRADGAHAYVELKRVSLERFGIDAVLDAVLPHLFPIRGRCTLISFDVAVLAAARARTELPVGPVLVTWSQRERADVTGLGPSVVFCDVEKLPPEGPLQAPAGELAIYEVDQPQVAEALFRRGARYVETFAIGAMLRALAGPRRPER